MAKAIPDGYHSVTPHLIVKGADRAIDFYKKVFGAAQRMSSRIWVFVAPNRLEEPA